MNENEIKSQIVNSLNGFEGGCTFAELQESLLSQTVDEAIAQSVLFSGVPMPAAVRYGSLEEMPRFLYQWRGTTQGGNVFDLLLNVSVKPCAAQFVVNTPPVLGIKGPSDLGVPVQLGDPLLRVSFKGSLDRAVARYWSWLERWGD